MGMQMLDVLRELTEILKSGGPYAVASIFIFLYIRADRYAKALAEELKNLAVAQVEGGVEGRMTLSALKDAMQGVEAEQVEVRRELNGIERTLGEIKLVGEQKLLNR